MDYYKRRLKRLLPKSNDRYKQTKRSFSLRIDQFHPKTGQFRDFFEFKNLPKFANSSSNNQLNKN